MGIGNLMIYKRKYRLEKKTTSHAIEKLMFNYSHHHTLEYIKYSREEEEKKN
jgi:hypothetical protein